MEVATYPKGGSIALDMINYHMVPGNVYDIGVTMGRKCPVWDTADVSEWHFAHNRFPNGFYCRPDADGKRELLHNKQKLRKLLDDI